MKTVKLVQIEPGIWGLTMDRAPALNALSRQLLADLHSALDQLKAMRECPSPVLARAFAPVPTSPSKPDLGTYLVPPRIWGSWVSSTNTSSAWQSSCSKSASCRSR